MFWHMHYLSIYLSIICLHGDFTTIKMLNSLKACHNQLLFFTQQNNMENYSHCCVYLYFIPFLLLSSIQWNEYTTVCLSSHSLKDIWSGLVPIWSFYFWLLKLLWTSICKSLWGLMFLFLLGKYLWMELVGHMLILCLIIWGTTQLFAKVVTQFYIPTSSIWECGFLCCWVASVVSDSVQPHRRQPTRLSRPWDSPGKNTGVGCHFLLQCMKVKSESEVAQLCPTPSNPMDCSPPGSSVHGICQVRALEWGAIAFSRRFLYILANTYYYLLWL